MRMLDNVIDINFYTIPEARRSNLRHRPVGLGVMGFQDALHILRIAVTRPTPPWPSRTQAWRRSAITRSPPRPISPPSAAAIPSFDGSLWSKGILPIDSIAALAEARGGVDDGPQPTLDWDALRERVETSACATPTAWRSRRPRRSPTSAASSQSIEPAYQNLYVKSNMSGDFTVVNEFLVRDLKARGLWDEVMVSDLKYFDGSVGQIDRVPDDLKALYATAFEIDSGWLIEAAVAPAEMDRPGAVAQPLHRQSLAARSSTRSIAWPGSAA